MKQNRTFSGAQRYVCLTVTDDRFPFSAEERKRHRTFERTERFDFCFLNTHGESQEDAVRRVQMQHNKSSKHRGIIKLQCEQLLVFCSFG